MRSPYVSGLRPRFPDYFGPCSPSRDDPETEQRDGGAIRDSLAFLLNRWPKRLCQLKAEKLDDVCVLLQDVANVSQGSTKLHLSRYSRCTRTVVSEHSIPLGCPSLTLLNLKPSYKKRLWRAPLRKGPGAVLSLWNLDPFAVLVLTSHCQHVRLASDRESSSINQVISGLWCLPGPATRSGCAAAW